MITVRRYTDAPKDWIVFNGKDLREYLVYCSGDQTFSAPQRRYDVITIPGRNGEFKIDQGTFMPIDVSYDCWIASDFRNNMQALRSYLLNTQGDRRIEDTYDPDHFRIGSYAGPLDVKAYYGSTLGTFTLTFHCKPERWRKDGELPITMVSGQKIRNDTVFDAKPEIHIKPASSAAASVTMCGYMATITGGTAGREYIIDTDIKQCWYVNNGSKVYANNLLTVTDRQDWFRIKPGEQTLTAANCTQIIIKPRWYDL